MKTTGPKKAEFESVITFQTNKAILQAAVSLLNKSPTLIGVTYMYSHDSLTDRAQSPFMQLRIIIHFFAKKEKTLKMVHQKIGILSYV